MLNRGVKQSVSRSCRALGDWNPTTAALAFILTFVLFLSGPPTSASADDFITGSGCSVSNVGYLTDLAREYERRTGVRVSIRGGGSVVGIEDLRSGKVDFAASCRPKTSSDSEDITFIQVAWDALVFIVHPSNPLTNISLDEIRHIYAGVRGNWQEFKGPDAPVKLFISRASRGLSGVEVSTSVLVLNGREPMETSNTLFVASTAIVEQMVETVPEGFAAAGYTSARKRNVKMLMVDNVAPTARNIIHNRYPLKRPLYLLLPKKPRPEVRKFVDFALSRDGQRFISSLNVVSLRDVK